MIHRDLKPSNILLTAVLKRRSSTLVALLRSETSPTQSLKLEGTVQYIAPEVLRGGIRMNVPIFTRSERCSMNWEPAVRRASENFAQDGLFHFVQIAGAAGTY